MLAAFATAFSIPPSPDTFAPTFQRLSRRFGNVQSRETSASSGDSVLLIKLDLEHWTFAFAIDSGSILDNYRRWKHRLRISISGTHFEGSFYTPPGGMELFTPFLQIFQRTQNHRPLEPENHSSFSEIMHVLTHQLFLKKAYHTYLLIHTTGPTNRAQCPRQPISYQPSLRKSIHMVLSNDPKLCTAHVRCGLTA